MSATTHHSPLHELLARAVERRRELLAPSDTNVARLFDADGDGAPGLVIERFGPALIVQIHIGRFGRDEDELRAAVETLLGTLGARGAYRKYFPRDRTRLAPDLELQNRAAAPWTGQPLDPEIEVLEHGRRFLVHPFDGFSTGLFLDHRERRNLVAKLGAGRNVLNAFSYTCGFGVAGGLGGAASVVNVDISRRYLEWGKRNLALNQITLDTQRFICSDVIDYYKRARRQSTHFDLIILDPPTFARTGRAGQVFSVIEQMDNLLDGALSILASPGIVLLSANHERLSPRDLTEKLRAAAARARRSVRKLVPQATAGDFPSQRTCSRSVMAEIA